MATATRVKQDCKTEGKIVNEVHTTDLVDSVDGKEVKRIPASCYMMVRDTRVRVPQPDRVTLDLSLEEARLLLNYDFQRYNSYHDRQTMGGIGKALNDALYPVKGTPASSNGGGCSPVDPTQGQVRKAGTATTGCGAEYDKARRDAEYHKKLHYSIFGG